MKKRAVLALSILIVLGLLIGGCGNGITGSPGPERVVQDFWKALQDGNIEKAMDYLTAERRADVLKEMEEDPVDMALAGEFIKAMIGAFSMDITGHNIDGDNAVVYVTYTHPDFEELFGLIMAKAFEMMMDESIDFDNMTEEEEMQMAIQLFTAIFEDIESTDTTDGEIPLVKEGGQWKLQTDLMPDIVKEVGF